MPGVGGSSSLDKFRGELRQLAAGGFTKVVVKRVAQAALAEVKKGFAESRDPYGRPWPASNGFGGSTLQSTRQLANSFTVATSPVGFRVGTSVRYAATHQYGATIKPVHAKLLSFEVPHANRIAVLSKGKYKRKRFGRAGTLTKRVFAKQVVVRRRQMVPENVLGPIWTRAFEVELEACVADLLGAP